jgi:hypothetical protein
MRKLLIALALVPAISHAALYIDESQKPAASAHEMSVAPAVLGPQAEQQVTAPAVTQITVEQTDPTWHVSPSDGDYRHLLMKWASAAGWDFSWDVDRDLPVTAHDTFTGPFKAAVRRELRATEMTSYQVKPCFYSNHLMRVVKITTKCDPSM